MGRKLLVISENIGILTEGYISIQAKALHLQGWDVNFLCCESNATDNLRSVGSRESFLADVIRCPNARNPRTLIQRAMKAARTYRQKNSELAGKVEIEHWLEKIKKIKPDIILVQFGTVAARIMPALISYSRPWVVHFHGFDITQRCQHWGYRRTLRYMLNMAPAVIGCSEFVVSKLMHYCQSSRRNHIFVISPGYDESRYKLMKRSRKQTGHLRFISVARLVQGKGHDITIRALARMERPWKLTIIGGGPEQASLLSLISDLGVESDVSLLGEQTPEVILKELSVADVFVQSSTRADDGWMEGLGLSPLEAAATGLPVIVSDSGGLGETCRDKETGLIYDEGDIDGLEASLNAFYNQPDLCKEYGNAGSNWVKKHYSSTHQAEKLSLILNNLTEEYDSFGQI